VIAALAQRRILCAYGLNDPHTLRFEPPAVITEAEVDHVCTMLREAVDQAKMLMGLASEA